MFGASLGDVVFSHGMLRSVCVSFKCRSKKALERAERLGSGTSTKRIIENPGMSPNRPGRSSTSKVTSNSHEDEVHNDCDSIPTRKRPDHPRRGSMFTQQQPSKEGKLIDSTSVETVSERTLAITLSSKN